MKRILTSLLGALIVGAPGIFAATATDAVPRDTSFTTWGTYLKMRKHHPELTIAAPVLPEGVKAQENVVYQHFDSTKFGPRDLHVDIYRPDNDEVLPALIMIHGGGWNSGDKTMQRPMAMQIAKAGYVTIPVEYRLIPEALYPAGLHDIKAVVRWVRANAATYGINPDKIAISGASAGAQLATLVGVTNGSASHEGSEGPHTDTSSAVQAVINMDGIATFVSEGNIRTSRESLEQKKRMPVNAQWLGGLYEEAPDNWNHASALNHITDASAPVCFISSGLPRYSDGREILCDEYLKRHIYTVRHVLPVDFHPFWLFNPWMERTVGYAVEFLDNQFK